MAETGIPRTRSFDKGNHGVQTSEKENGRLALLEDHATRTEGRLGVIERTQVDHGDKLDRIVVAVTRYDALPKSDFSKNVSMARDLVVMGSVLASLAVWLVITLTAANDRVTDLRLQVVSEKIDWVTKRVDWQPQVQSVSPKVDIPQR
jgi:hypothetical protein